MSEVRKLRKKAKPKLRGGKMGAKKQDPNSIPLDTPYHAQRKENSLRSYSVGSGMSSVSSCREELADMTDVLVGRASPPYWHGPITLMELADTFYSRASEMTMLIQQAEADERIPKGSAWAKFRTGELRTFMEMCKRAADLGSRYITDEQLRFEQEKTGRESMGFR